MTIAIITARGGSRRLPRKNVKPFLGIPLVAWAIVQARTSQNIDEVWVSTDDDEIESISKEYGANVIRRPDWPDANECAANRPFCHAIEKLIQRYGRELTEILTILPTTPLNKPGDFDKGIELYRAWGADQVLGLRPQRETLLYKKINGYRAKCSIFAKGYEYLGESGGWTVCSPGWYLTMNRELPSDLDRDLDKWNQQDAPWIYYFPVECWQYADVDTAEEFELAEIIFDHYISHGQGIRPYLEYEAEHPKKPRVPWSLETFGNVRQFEGD